MVHDVLMNQMEERFREKFAKALKTLEDAPDGHWIEASEIAFRDAALIAGREGLELALQAKVDVDPTAQAASFSPHAPRRSSRIQPTGPLVGIGRSLMPQSMVTPR